MKIFFNPVSTEHALYATQPEPASKNIPQWFKHLPAFENNKLEIDSGGDTNATGKLCAVFSDALTSGYVQKLWTDIYIDLTIEGQLTYKWPINPQPMDVRGENFGKTFPPMAGFYPFEFTWNVPWMPELPEGYSALITHPLNRPDLPFVTLSGVIDSDGYKYGTAMNSLPFFIKSSFTGLIPVGTPLFQIIPFKRENWSSEVHPFDAEKQRIENYTVRRKFWGGYKSAFRKKKKYE